MGIGGLGDWGLGKHNNPEQHNGGTSAERSAEYPDEHPHVHAYQTRFMSDRNARIQRTIEELGQRAALEGHP